MLFSSAAAARLSSLSRPEEDCPSLIRCYSDGCFDSQKFLLTRNKRSADFENEYGWDVDGPELSAASDRANDAPPPLRPRGKRSRRPNRVILARRNEEGELEAIPPTESMWYHLYVSCPHSGDERFEKMFRRRLRLPYQSFLEFVEDARANNWFPRSTRCDATKKDPLSLELLILGAFRYIGRGFTFDDLEEATAISEETHRP